MDTPKSLKIPDPNFSFASKVRVILRARPFLPREIAAKNGNPISCVSVLGQDSETRDEVTVQLKDPATIRNECYQLDSFFGQEDDNVSRIFEKEVSPLIPGIFSGFNATVFAYGATGSGKTFTMQGTNDLPGLMPLAISQILALSASTGSVVEISYYEVYMDRCYDLLELKEKEIAIMDDKDGQIHLKGLSRVQVNSTCEFHEVFSLGIQRRKTAHTGLNDVSSRSHGVLVIRVSTPLGDGAGSVLTGKLNLIDLAGNEDNRRTSNDGLRLQESAKINQSLFALSNVIYALNNDKPRVPYRDSKLTRILQDSLGGTSRALMVACLNPGEYQESVRTVSLAARSRHISNFISSAKKLETPKGKVDMEAKLRAWLESKGKTKSIQRIGAHGTTPLPTSARKLNYHSSVKAKVDTNRVASNAKERAPSSSTHVRNLFSDEDLINSCLEDPLTTADNIEAIGVGSAEIALQTTRVGTLDDEEEKRMLMDCSDSIMPSAAIDKENTHTSGLRKVLSPINNNAIKPSEEVSSLIQKYPVTPSTMTCSNKNPATIGTPLEKFSASSRSLKYSLMQEYTEFLNSASKEELMEIKGIGPRIAEYIVELRETSPLKSISDLEKIGLSSKQVHNMVNRVAQGIFARQASTNTQLITSDGLGSHARIV